MTNIRSCIFVEDGGTSDCLHHIGRHVCASLRSIVKSHSLHKVLQSASAAVEPLLQNPTTLT